MSALSAVDGRSYLQVAKTGVSEDGIAELKARAGKIQSRSLRTPATIGGWNKENTSRISNQDALYYDELTSRCLGGPKNDPGSAKLKVKVFGS